MFIPDKKQLVDKRGMPLSQGLFLEIGYNTEFAVYTLKEDDFEYKGKTYPSLKKLYLEYGDPLEYEFANTFLLNWSQWKKLLDNKQVKKHIDEWREELEIKKLAQSYRDIENQSESNFSAAKWIADRGWKKRAAGRPTKQEETQRKSIEERAFAEFKDDMQRLQ